MSGILNIYVSSTSGKITIPNTISVESLTLKMWRYEFGANAQAQAGAVLTFSAPWTRVGSVSNGVDISNTDATHAFDGLAIPLSDQLVGVGYTNIRFDVGRVIERTFSFTLTGFDLTGFSNLLLVFEYKLK